MIGHRRLWLAAGAVLAAAAAAAVLLVPWQEDETVDGPGLAPGVAIDWRDDALVGLGERVYAEQCASCHGADLAGQPNWQVRDADGLLPAPPHDETGHTWHHADDQLFALTKYGPAAFAGSDYRSAMPAYDGILTDEEIAAALAYIKRQWPPEIRERHDQLDAANRP